MLRYRFSNERCVCVWEGGLNHLPLLFREIVYRIKRHLKMINALHERKTYQPLTLPWLGTPSRTMDQLSTRNRTDINWQLATDKYQLTTRNWQISTDNSQLATDKYQLTTRNWPISTRNWQISTDNSQLATNNWQISTRNWQISTDSSKLATDKLVFSTSTPRIWIKFNLCISLVTSYLATHFWAGPHFSLSRAYLCSGGEGGGGGGGRGSGY